MDVSCRVGVLHSRVAAAVVDAMCHHGAAPERGPRADMGRKSGQPPGAWAPPSASCPHRLQQWASWEGADSAWGGLGAGSAAGVPLLSGTEGFWHWAPLLRTPYKDRGASQKFSGPPEASWQMPALQTGARAAGSVKEAGASSKVPASAAMGMLCIASPHARRSPGPPGGEAEGKVPREDQLTPGWKGDALGCPALWLCASME